MKNRLDAIGQAFDNLRHHIRPEGDAAAGALAVAIAQAKDDAEPAPTEPAAKKVAAKKTARR